MWASLHKFELLQGSVKENNITVQSGPLWLPVNELSYANSNFKIERSTVHKNLTQKCGLRDPIISERDGNFMK